MKELETRTNNGELPPRPQPGRFDRGRREVLRKLGMAGVAISAPLVLPSRLLAQAVAKSDTPPPSERLNIGLVGMGSAMNDHLRALQPNKDIFIRAVCDVDKRKLIPAHTNVLRGYRTVAADYGQCLATQDHREMMARDDIDGVVVATPVHWNAAIALDAIRSGKDVLCQTPVSLTVREGQLLEAAAREHGAIFQMVTPFRGEGPMLYLCELVRNGYIGKVKEIYVKVDAFGEEDSLPSQAVPAELDYDRWLGPAPWADYHSVRIAGGRVTGWRRFWEYGVRRHGEFGFGYYDIIQWALDAEKTMPVEFVPKGGGDSPFASYRYDKGPVVYLDHPITDEKDLEIVGTQGSLSISSRGQITSDPEDLDATKLGAADLRLPEIDASEFSWLECVKVRSQPVADAGVAHRSSAICHLNAIAERLGRTIQWDPDKQEIIGDPIASRMLDRPRRAPYTI